MRETERDKLLLIIYYMSYSNRTVICCSVFSISHFVSCAFETSQTINTCPAHIVSFHHTSLTVNQTTIYRIAKNFSGEKTLANLANRHNSPSFSANFYLVQCHVVCHSQPFMCPLNNKRGASPLCMKAAAALYSLSMTALVITTNHNFHSEPRTTTHR